MKKTISMVLALLMIFSVMFAVPFTASAAGVNAFYYTFKVDTFDRLAEAVARADGGDRILLTDDINEKIDFNNPIEFQSYASKPGGTVVLDLDGHKLNITSDKLTNLFVLTEKTQLFVINGNPRKDSYINFNSTKGYASVFKLNNVEASLIVSNVDISLSFDTNYQYTDGYKQTSVISCLDFYQFYLLDSKLTNYTCNGAGIKFKSNTATSYDQSSIKILNSVIKSTIYCIDYEDNSDWASMYFMYSDLDCNEENYKVFDLPSDCTLTFSGITGRYADAFKVLTIGDKKTYTSIDPNMKLVNFDIKCDMNFDSQLYCEHSYSTLVNTAGGHYKYCTGCGISTGYEAHNGKTNAVAATCVSEGKTEGYNCSCGYKIASTVIPIDSSKHVNTEVIRAVAATCTTTGNTAGTVCKDCKAIIRRVIVIPATNHKNAVDKEAVAPTCTEKGYTAGKFCPDCNTWISGHEEISAKGHTETVDPAVAPTCTTAGKTEGKHCSVCNAVLVAQTVVPATGNHTGKTVITPATLTADGKKVTTCTVCNKTLDTTAIAKIASVKLSATKYTYDGKVKTPSVTVKDSKGKVLKKGTDYTVSYASGRKNTGKYTVTVTFTGDYSESKTLSFNILPGKTSKLTATQTATSIKASWKAVTGTSGYKVILYTAKNKTVKTVYTTKTTASFTKLSKGTTYKVKVYAYKTIDGKKVYASSSALITTTTAPGAPTLKATAGKKKATLSWNKQTGASGYVLYMATSKNGKYSKIATLKGNSKVSFTKTGLSKGKTCYFKVKAYKTLDGKTVYGDYSAVKSAKIK